MSSAYIGISALIILILTFNYLLKRFKYDLYKKQIDKKYSDGFFWGGRFNVAPIPIDDDTNDTKLQSLKNEYNKSVKYFWITIITSFIIYILLSMIFNIW